MVDPKKIAEWKALAKAATPLTLKTVDPKRGEEVTIDIRARGMDFDGVCRFHEAAREAIPALVVENDALRAMLREVDGVLRVIEDGDDVLGSEGVAPLRRHLAALLGEKP